jgi:hypothetical protein
MTCALSSGASRACLCNLAGFLLKRFKQKTKKNNEENGHRRFLFVDKNRYLSAEQTE